MSELTDQIESMIDSAVEDKVRQYKTALQEAIGILQALVGEPEFCCDDCGDKFVPTNKVVKTRTALCADCIDKKPHPRLDYSPEASAKRSEAQQNRRALEKTVDRTVAMHDCKNCGKPTTKLYCSDTCRKESEQRLIKASEVPFLKNGKTYSAKAKDSLFRISGKYPASGSLPIDQRVEYKGVKVG